MALLFSMDFIYTLEISKINEIDLAYAHNSKRYWKFFYNWNILILQGDNSTHCIFPSVCVHFSWANQKEYKHRKWEIKMGAYMILACIENL